jgi:hypothetical protein
MRPFRIFMMLSVLLPGVCLPAAAQEQKPITVTGKLVRVMAIGGEINRLDHSARVRDRCRRQAGEFNRS